MRHAPGSSFKHSMGHSDMNGTFLEVNKNVSIYERVLLAAQLSHNIYTNYEPAAKSVKYVSNVKRVYIY